MNTNYITDTSFSSLTLLFTSAILKVLRGDNVCIFKRNLQSQSRDFQACFIYYLCLLYLSKTLNLNNNDDRVKTISLWIYFNNMQTNFSHLIALVLKQFLIYNINIINVTKAKVTPCDQGTTWSLVPHISPLYNSANLHSPTKGTEKTLAAPADTILTVVSDPP